MDGENDLKVNYMAMFDISFSEEVGTLLILSTSQRRDKTLIIAFLYSY